MRTAVHQQRSKIFLSCQPAREPQNRLNCSLPAIFAGLLKEAGLHFDRIVLDSAPINAVSDTHLIAKEIQSVCFVRAVKTPGRAIISACSLLAQTGSNIDGIVFNRMPRRSRDRYYFSEYACEYAKPARRGAEVLSLRFQRNAIVNRGS